VAQRRGRLDEAADGPPQRTEVLSGARREIAREQRRVVVAQVLPEEGQAARQSTPFDCERKQKEDFIAAPGDHDRGLDAGERSDVALPAGEPVEGLERRAVGGLLETAPVVLGRRDVLMQHEPELGGGIVGKARRRPRGRFGAQRHACMNECVRLSQDRPLQRSEASCSAKPISLNKPL
jgi:hypothetical protein